MTRKITTEGDSLLAALRQAVADLVDCDPEKVELKLDAPGFDASAELGVKLRLQVDEPSDEDTSDGDTSGDNDTTPSSSRSGDGDAGGPSVEELDEEADAAADFMEGLLDILDLPGDLKIRVDEDHAEVEVVEVGSGALIGRRGQTLESIQELLRSALQSQFQRRCRVMVDVEGYRVRRLDKLKEKAREAIDEVLDTGESVRLEPMDVFERKSIHRLVAEHDGVTSRSQGREPGRRIVIEAD